MNLFEISLFSLGLLMRSLRNNILKLSGWFIVLLKGSLKHRIHLNESCLVWLNTLKTYLWSLWDLNWRTYSHTLGFIFRPLVLKLPLIWILIRRYFLICYVLPFLWGWKNFKNFDKSKNIRIHLYLFNRLRRQCKCNLKVPLKPSSFLVAMTVKVLFQLFHMASNISS